MESTVWRNVMLKRLSLRRLHMNSNRPTSSPFGRRWLLGQCALLLMLLATFALAAVQVHRYEDDVRRTSFTLSGSLPVPVLRFAPTDTALNVVAVIAHGYSANKELMSAFAVDLAKQGIVVYTFDFPGHGASSVPYGTANSKAVIKQLTTSLDDVVTYALSQAPTSRVVLLGYSLGTIPVSEFALQHPHMSNLAATVLVAGLVGDHPTRTEPRNLLVLTGQFDLPGINDTARSLMAYGCGVAPAIVTDRYSCGSSPLAERQRMVLAGLDHISIVTAASTHAATIEWLHDTVDARIGATIIHADDRLHWLVLAFFSAALALLPLLSLGSYALRLSPSHVAALPAVAAEKGSSPPEQIAPVVRWALLGTCLAALTSAVLLLRVYLPADFWSPESFPFTFLRQMVSADVAVYFLIAGLILVALLAGIPVLRRAAAWPQRSAVWAQISLALALALFLYATNGILSSFAWESVVLGPARLWRTAVYTLMLLPFLVGMRAVVVSWARGRWGIAAAVDFGLTLSVLGALGASIALNFARLSYLGILLPVIALVMVAFIPVSAWAVRVMARPTLLLGVMQALLLGWALAATLPLIN
jgi:pimeloyl-ACP methyl ester carboxylesterase